MFPPSATKIPNRRSSKFYPFDFLEILPRKNFCGFGVYQGQLPFEPQIDATLTEAEDP
jgi:hypothetical protein